MPPQVIIYRYDRSPFSFKAEHVLALKHVPHQRVNVPMILPRPDITQLLGIHYRRIPILAIDNDVYCDTSLIASTLERRFPADQGYGTIFPPRKGSNSKDTGLIKAFSKFYCDDTLFLLSVGQMDWKKLPQPFVKDRGEFQGMPVDVERLAASQPEGLSKLSSHIAQVEEQLQDGREWLFDTITPSLADVSICFILSWIQSIPSAQGLISEETFPQTLHWLSRARAHLDTKKASNAAVAELTGEQAAKSICSSNSESADIVGLDHTELGRLGLEPNSQVAVFPEDTGRNFHTVGALIGLNKEEVVLRVEGSAGTVRCHFPRLGFKVVRAKESEGTDKLASSL